MRAWLLAAIWGASFSLVAACGDAEADFEDDATRAGQATAGTAGAAGSAGSASGGSASGGSASGGSASGAGTSSGGAAEAGAGGGGAGGGGAGGDGGEGALVDCDPRKITCKRATPVCGAMEVPSVEGSCYGECVKIERCACDAPAACPNPNEFTCWNNAQHCGPFVQ